MQRFFFKRLNKITKSLHKYTISKPHLGLILGSGLGDFIDSVPGTTIPFKQIAGFPYSTIKGHAGILKIGEKLAVMGGRFHYYEGYSSDEVILPIFVLHKLGVKKLIITNAAGAINNKYKPGDIILIKDHLNLLGKNPLRGYHLDASKTCFVDMTNAYSKRFRKIVKNLGLGINYEGVYVAVPGPSYETYAETVMLRRLGCDMVGMSTVWEVIAARYLEMEVLGISCITNMAAGLMSEPLKHDDILLQGKRMAESLKIILLKTIAELKI